LAEETIEWSRPADLSGATIVRCRNATQLWSWFHETYTFCAVVAGQGSEWTYRGKLHRTGGAGATMFLEPGETHAQRRQIGSASYDVMFLDAGAVDALARELSAGLRTPHFRPSQVLGPRTFEQMVLLMRAFFGQTTTLERQSRLATFVETCLGYTERTPTAGRDTWERPAVGRARALLHDRLADNVSLDELAQVAGISRFHLLREFTRLLGLPPHQYQILARVSAASRMLARGEPPAEVATSLGFADQSHLGRHFRRIAHTSPGRYAAVVRGASRG